MRNRAMFATTLGGLVLFAAACSERQFQPGFQDDDVGPSISVDKTQGDTLDVSNGIQFGVTAVDNLGLSSLTIALTGGYTVTVDTVFTTAVTQVALNVRVELDDNTTAGGLIYINATAIDGNNNQATVLDSIYLRNEDALTVRIVRPNAGALTSPSRQIVVELVAQHTAGVQVVGYTSIGVVVDSSSVGYTSPLPTDTTFTDTLTVPAGTSEGTFTITGFAQDSTGRSATSTAITVTVQSVTNDTDPPVVGFSISPRVEVDDSITVTATDPGGIAQVGWYALLRDDTTVSVGGASLNAGGTLTDVSETWPLDFNFPPTNLPRFVVIRAWAEDANGNRDTTATPSASGAPQAAPGMGAAAAAAMSDTVLVVHGTTTPLPDGGRVIDGIYNRNLNEVYLTNVDLGRIEVFQVADTSFVAGGISVGARPWGIALWPRDADGNNADTVVVANSGGTDLSIVDLGARREVRRHSLPNFIVDEVTTEMDASTGFIQIKFTRHDFSDRPQYLGMTCRPGVGNCDPNQIVAVYSTTPTIDQGDNPLRGSLRWENLTNPTPSSHFFWEHAEVPPSPDWDTLRVFVDRGQGTSLDTVLSTACGRMVNMDNLVFREVTYVRNSGDFSHTLAGEGGVIGGDDFAQAVGFNAQAGVSTGTCTGVITVTTGTINFTGPFEEDLGITTSFRVSDFISNTATTVNSIAINFNGLTNMIRTADSVYVLNESMRLKGLISEEGVNPGMDLNFDHAFEAGIGGTPGTFGGTGDPDDRLVFLAVSDPEIEIYDSFFFEKVLTLPIRDPIIGPLRVARLASGDQILVGVTAYGVVTIQLPAVTNIFPSAGVENPQQ